MAFKHHYFDKLTSEDQENTIAEIERVLRAVSDLGPDADPAEVKKLFAMLKPGTPDELDYVTIEEAA